jgi:hypothetical protein
MLLQNRLRILTNSRVQNDQLDIEECFLVALLKK